MSAIEGAWLDEEGSLVLATELGPGLVHDHDLPQLETSFVDVNGGALAEDVLEQLMELAARGEEVPVWFKFGEHNLRVGSIRSGAVPARFGYVREPREP